MSFATLRIALQDRLKNPRSQAILRWMQRLLTVGVIAWLAFQLWQIGVGQIVRSLPWRPEFYLLYAVLYALGPCAETAFFRRCWNIPWRTGMLVMFRKNIYNAEIFDCAGEVYLYAWVRKHLQLSERETFRGVKDNAILSAATSTMLALVLPAVCLSANLLMVERLPAWSHKAIYLGPAVAVALAVLLFAMRRRIFGLPDRILMHGVLIHAVRVLSYAAVLITQYRVADGTQPLRFWLTVVVLQQFCTRLPSMPIRDMLFVALGVQLSQGSAAVASVLLVNSMLDKVLNLGLFSTTLIKHDASLDAPQAAPPDEAEPAPSVHKAA